MITVWSFTDNVETKIDLGIGKNKHLLYFRGEVFFYLLQMLNNLVGNP